MPLNYDNCLPRFVIHGFIAFVSGEFIVAEEGFFNHRERNDCYY